MANGKLTQRYKADDGILFPVKNFLIVDKLREDKKQLKIIIHEKDQIITEKDQKLTEKDQIIADLRKKLKDISHLD